MAFQTKDKRYINKQEDVITFLKKQPSNSVWFNITDPAYSGMNQMLKLGKGKIIGKYNDKGDGQKVVWWNSMTQRNYEIFFKWMFKFKT